MSNDTTLLFGLEGVQIVSVEADEEANPLLALVTADEEARCCPGCGERSAHPHSWVLTRPRDLPVAGRRTVLTWTKRRWRCENPACVRTTFTQSIPQIPPRSRLTGRLRQAVGAAVAVRHVNNSLKLSTWQLLKVDPSRAGKLGPAMDVVSVPS